MTSTTNKATLRRFFQEVWNDGDGRLSGHWQIADRLGVYQQLSAR